MHKILTPFPYPSHYPKYQNVRLYSIDTSTMKLCHVKHIFFIICHMTVSCRVHVCNIGVRHDLFLSFSPSLKCSLLTFKQQARPMPNLIPTYRPRFRKAKIGALVSFSSTGAKALPASSVQTKGLLFFKQSVICAAKLLKLRMNRR